MNLIISDIDGIIADCSHRLSWAKAKLYDEFYSDANVLRDEPIESGITFLKMLSGGLTSTTRVVFCTGRNETCKDATREWLHKKVKLDYDALYMRKDGDHRKSEIAKVELVEEIIRSYIARGENVTEIYYIDDDPNNVKAVCEQYNSITGITFGIERMKKDEDNA